MARELDMSLDRYVEAILAAKARGLPVKLGLSELSIGLTAPDQSSGEDASASATVTAERPANATECSAPHAETSEWLSRLSSSLRQLAVYRLPLGRALESARGGDQRFVALPRVDSYHSVWFELHEHLIRLVGRRRANEAGRA